MKKQQINIRLSLEEKEKLEQRAKKAGLTVSEYIRKASINQKQKFLTNDDRELFSQLRSELRNTANIRNRNEALRPIIDPIRKQLRQLLNRFQ